MPRNYRILNPGLLKIITVMNQGLGTCQVLCGTGVDNLLPLSNVARRVPVYII